MVSVDTVNGKAVFICFMILSVFLFLIMQVIRGRLQKRYPTIFIRLGSPTMQDSNLGRTYWTIQKFVWWQHMFVANDWILRSLCMLACISQLVGVVLFFYLV